MSAWTVIKHEEVPSGGITNIEFTSIPQTYTDIAILLSARSTRAELDDVLLVKPNGSSSNLTFRRLSGSGSAAASTAENRIYINGDTATSNTFSNNLIYFPNYAGSTNKSFSADSVTENNNTEAYMSIVAALWSQTTAISSIVLTASSGDFKQYTSATLYGITKGSSGGVTVS